MNAEQSSYVFGPLERRGLIAGLRAGQVALIGLGVAGLVVGLSAMPILGVALFLAALGFAFAPIGGRNADLWAPITTAFWFRRLTAGRQWRNDAMRLGHIDGEPTWPTLPAHLAKAFEATFSRSSGSRPTSSVTLKSCRRFRS
jgi:hypothetical protein